MIYIKIQNLARCLIIHPDLSVEWCFVWQSVNIFSYQSDNSSQDYIPTDTARQIDFQNLWEKLVRNEWNQQIFCENITSFVKYLKW